MAKELYLGLMSGTSLDGVDAVLMDMSGTKPTVLAAGFTTMPDDIRKELAMLCLKGEASLKKIGELDHRLGELYALAANELLTSQNTDAEEDVKGIGCHGQTIWHAPWGDFPFTMQIGDANIIAARTGITTVADFRRKDVAFGGQGAPLVPAFHEAVFTRPDTLTVVLNIGGISNISVLNPGLPTLGYDTGPGNLLLDAWTEKHLGERFDRDAAWAKTGNVVQPLLDHLMDETFFSQKAPKSTGRELFSLTWLQDKLTHFGHVAARDVQATLVELTARSISQELQKYPENKTAQQLLVCGGGAKNPLLMQRLSLLLPSWSVGTTTEHGLDVDYVEAAAFAWLACQRLSNLPGNLPSVTGASRYASLGAIYPADRFQHSGI